LFKIIKAPIIPGIKPIHVRIKTIRKDPHPLSTTDKGGKITAKITLNNDIIYFF